MKIGPLGENTVLIEFGNKISVELNEKAIALCDRLAADPFPGFIEAVPAYASAAVYYDLPVVRKAFPEFATATAAVTSIVEKGLKTTANASALERRLVEIPVTFDKASALDLEEAAALKELSPEEFLTIFLSRTYRVYMLGFLPGFAYMGEVDERIAVSRRDTPRTRVPKGSVGIAGRQTGIYPLDSPGGWQVIGKTDTALFDPRREEPCLLRPGDEVRFVKQEQ